MSISLLPVKIGVWIPATPQQSSVAQHTIQLPVSFPTGGDTPAVLAPMSSSFTDGRATELRMHAKLYTVYCASHLKGKTQRELKRDATP